VPGVFGNLALSAKEEAVEPSQTTRWPLGHSATSVKALVEILATARIPGKLGGMKVQIQLDVPEDTTANDLQVLIREFRFLARLRGWRLLLGLPNLKRCMKKAR
jgi:hypothetical protein